MVLPSGIYMISHPASLAVVHLPTGAERELVIGGNAASVTVSDAEKVYIPLCRWSQHLTGHFSGELIS
jgi:hypothetical protein